MTEVRRAVNTFYVLDGGYCVTEGIAKDKGKYFEAVLAADYTALAARVQAVERERDEAQRSKNQCVIELYQKLDKFDDLNNELREERDSLRASCHTFEQQLTEAQGKIARQQEQLRLCNIDQLQAEQQVTRLREKGWALLDRLSGTTYPNAACVAIDELAKALREAGA